MLLAAVSNIWAEDAVSTARFSSMNTSKVSYGSIKTTVSELIDPGIQYWIGDNSTYSGDKIVVITDKNIKLQILVGAFSEGSSGNTSEKTLEDISEVTTHELTLDTDIQGKYIQKIQIKSTSDNSTDDIVIQRIYLMTSESKTYLDLSNFKLMSAGSPAPTMVYTMTTDEAWNGIQDWIGDDSSTKGNRLVIKTTEAAKLKVSVGYVGGASADYNAGNEGATERILQLQPNMAIQKIQIQQTEAGDNNAPKSVTFTEFSVDSSTDGSPESAKLNLIDAFKKEDENVSYENHKMETSASWKGIKYSTEDGITQASTIVVKNTEDGDKDSNLKIAAYYTDGWSTEYFNQNSHERTLKLDANRKIGTLQIQNQEEASTDSKKSVTFSEIYLDTQSTDTYTSAVAPKYYYSLENMASEGNATYSDRKLTINASKTATLDLSSNQQKGNNLIVEMESTPKVNVTVTYSDETKAQYMAGESGSNKRTLKLENDKEITKIEIGNTDGSNSAIVTKLYLDEEDNSSSEASVDYGTELTPTSTLPVATENYANYAQYDKAWFSDAKVGDIITVSISGVGEGSQIALQSDWKNLNAAAGADLTAEATSWQYTLTASGINQLKDNGLSVTGRNITIKKVYMKSVGSESPDISEVALANFDDINIESKEGKQLYAGSSPNISAQNKKLVVTLSAAAKLKVAVYLVDVDNPITEEVTADGTAKSEYSVPLGSEDKKIKKILITNNGTEAVTYSSISLEDYVDPNLIWSGSQELTSTALAIAADKFNNVESGNRIRLTIGSTSEGDKTMVVTYTSGTTPYETFNGTVKADTYDFEITATNIAAIQESGISITGTNATLTKVERITDAYTTGEISLTELPLDWGGTYDSDPESQTVSFTTAWQGRGWNVGDDKYNTKNNITLGLTEDPTNLQVEMNYVDAYGKTVTSIGTQNGNYLHLAVPSGIVRILNVVLKNKVANISATFSSVSLQTTQTLKNATQKMVNETVGTKVLIANSAFANVSAGDIITVNLSEVAESEASIVLKENSIGTSLFGSNYSKALTSGQTSFTHTLTADDMTLLTDDNTALCITGEGFTCGNITIASAGNITADVDHTTMYVLSVTQPTAGGKIQISGTDAVAQKAYDNGSQVTLTAVRDGGYALSKWTKDGADAGSENPLSVTFNGADVAVTATFVEDGSDPNVIWEGNEAIINWNEVAIAAGKFSQISTDAGNRSLQAGDKLVFGIEYTGGDYPQMVLRNSSSDEMAGSSTTLLSEGMNQVTYFINSQMLTELSSGLKISGTGFNLKSVKLEADDDPTTVWTGLVAGSTNFDTNDVLNTNNEKILAGVEAKDTIYIYTTGVATGARYELKYKVGDNWAWTELISGTSVPEIIKYAATAESALLIADRGLVISGSGYSINKISLHKFKETPLTAGETRTLWENIDGTAVTWNKIGTQGATLGAILEVGEKILVTVKSASTTETDRQVCLRDANSEIVTGFSSFDEVTSYPYVAKFTLTSDYVNKLQNGFHISGTNTTVTKMELYKPLPDTRTEKNLYGEVAMDSTVSDGITIAAEKFVNISEDDVLMIYLSGTKATDFITLRETTNWTQLTSSYKEYMTAGQTVFTLTLNDVNVAKLKAGGLNLTGGNFTITKITIKTNGEIPADEGGEEEGGDDDETIIDKKTGEADLAQLAAQDDTKTTLTQNEDGSITMTTTEAYQAAQIWFNDPEPVAGNVLKVELAESSVNVTVTVKYTDGTESQMSANTMAAKARGVTRAVSSGSTIEVPLDAGKEVQNIEVKNNVAGTITIKKMQVTTVNVFTNGVANLSMLKPQSNATYDTAAHTLATTKGWTGATISPVANENVSGKELLIEFADASKVKVAVKYRTDVEGPSTIMEKAAKAVRLALDNSKNIQEISIQPTEAAIVTFTKIAVNSEETDDGSLKPGKTITLWENAAGETLAWNEVAKQDASVGETLKEYDELLITVSGVTKGCDWPKVFIRDASSEQAGNEVLLNDIGSFPYIVRIVLTGEMAQQLKKGFSICGDGVTVTKLQVYRPEAPKPGDIHLADLNYGYNSSYDKGTHTITTTARWAARGWEIGDKRYNDKNLITVKFEPVDFPVTLKMEYTTGLQTAQATSVGVPAGRTELLLEIPSGISKLNRVYIIYENPGSVKLTEASVTYQDNLKLSTAIRSFEADGVIRDGRYDTDGWYNLRGMRIPEPKTSGVYIHGGKKVVIY